MPADAARAGAGTRPHTTLAYLACALASSFWGCGFFFGKIALAEMSVGAMVFYRFAFAIVLLLPVLLTHRPNLTASDWRTLLISAFFGVPVQFLLQFKGLSLTTVSHAALMVGTIPVLLAFGATMFNREHMEPIGWAAVALSTVGAAMIVLAGDVHAAHDTHGPTLLGDAYVILSMCIAVFWILMNQRLLARHSPTTISAWGLLLGFCMLAIMEPILYGPPPVHGIPPRAWAALAASGLLCTVSTTLLWNWGLTHVPASRAGVLLNIEPLMGSIMGVLLLHEKLGGFAWLGGAIIIASAVMMTTARRPGAKPQPLPDPVG